jgi:hypothetical protein
MTFWGGYKIGGSFLAYVTFPKVHSFNTKMKKNLKTPMLNVDYVVINELTKFK